MTAMSTSPTTTACLGYGSSYNLAHFNKLRANYGH
jgi:hypothetical protein